jgi:hypothetical protein
MKVRHHLMFIEELDKSGKEEVVCRGCEELVLFGPTYKLNAQFPNMVQRPICSLPDLAMAFNCSYPKTICHKKRSWIKYFIFCGSRINIA